MLIFSVVLSEKNIDSTAKSEHISSASHLGQSEEPDPRDDDEGHRVEASADVGEEPQAEAELGRVDEILDEEETAQLGQAKVDLVHGAGGEVADGVLRHGGVDG